MSVKIDILIPAVNNSYFTCALIKSIKNTTKIPFNIIYIDNGSEASEFNNVLISLQDINHLIIRNHQNLGFVKAINQGLKLSTAEYICFQNNDTLVFDNCFERLIKHLDNLPNVGIISPIASEGGGKQGIEILKSRWSWLDKEISRIDLCRSSHADINNFLYQRFQNQATEVNTSLAFFSVVMSRRTFERIGYLDERYGLGLYEDDDYCQRIVSAGLKLYIALDVYVWHLASTTFKSIYSDNKIMNLLIENQKIFEDKWINA
jgi:GT2 family glycosyltransferase